MKENATFRLTDVWRNVRIFISGTRKRVWCWMIRFDAETCWDKLLCVCWISPLSPEKGVCVCVCTPWLVLRLLGLCQEPSLLTGAAAAPTLGRTSACANVQLFVHGGAVRVTRSLTCWTALGFSFCLRFRCSNCLKSKGIITTLGNYQ